MTAEAKIIELIPQWSAVAAIAIMALEDGTDEGRVMARETVMDMGKKLDEMNERLTGLKEKVSMAMKGETVLTGAPHPGTELQVMSSGAGFYLGYRDKDGMPYSRESDYFQSEIVAQKMLDSLRGAS
jgi:hypothetical protein